MVSHHLIQWLKALQKLSFPHDWFPSESDYFKIGFAVQLLFWAILGFLNPIRAASFWNKQIIKGSLEWLLLSKISFQVTQLLFLENISDHMRQIAFWQIAKTQVHMETRDEISSSYNKWNHVVRSKYWMLLCCLKAIDEKPP